VNHLLQTWEDLDDLRARFPSFQLEDELDFEAGRDVMCGRTYARHRQDRGRTYARRRQDRQRLPDRQHLMGRTYSRRRRARDVRRAAERAEHACEKDSATRG
jgi:hypothetical protein